MFEIKPLIGVSYELIFQIINTILATMILIFIVYGVYLLLKKLSGSSSRKNKIDKLEKRIEELERKIDKK